MVMNWGSRRKNSRPLSVKKSFRCKKTTTTKKQRAPLSIKVPKLKMCSCGILVFRKKTYMKVKTIALYLPWVRKVFLAWLPVLVMSLDCDPRFVARTSGLWQSKRNKLFPSASRKKKPQAPRILYTLIKCRTAIM